MFTRLPDDVLADVLSFLPIKACRRLCAACRMLDAVLPALPSTHLILEGSRLTANMISRVMRARACPTVALSFASCHGWSRQLALLLLEGTHQDDGGDSGRGDEANKSTDFVNDAATTPGLQLRRAVCAHWLGASWLEILDISNSDVADDCLEVFGRYFSSLRSIGLASCRGITDVGARQLILPNHGSLRHLVLSGCVQLTETTLLDAVCKCSRLETLDLAFCGAVTERGLVAVARGCHMLTALDTSDALVGVVSQDILLELLTNCSGLRDLVLHSVSNDSLDLLHAPFPALETLGMCEGARLTDKAFKALAVNFPSLKRLSLAGLGRGVTEEGMNALRRLPALSFLSLIHCPFLADGSLRALLSPSLSGPKSLLSKGAGTLVVSKCPLITEGSILAFPPTLKVWCNGCSREELAQTFDLFG